MPLMRFGHDVSYKVLDRGLIEYLGPYGISKISTSVSATLSRIQSGLIYNYAFTIFMFATAFLILPNLAGNM